jgi:hypothetical protein
MYDAIVRNVVDREEKPHLVFFTGDLAFSGAHEEYDRLDRLFLKPLRQALGADPPILTVPGNHDVQRKSVVNPRLWMVDPEQRRVFQQVDSEGQQKRADAILPRFKNYRAAEKLLGAWPEDWLASERGTAFTLREIEGRRLAVIGMNTAWLCHDDHDWGHIAGGKTMVDAALKTAQSELPDLTIVLGHHPLAALTGEQPWSDGDRIRTRLEQANAVYLHGHYHRARTQRAGDSAGSLLAIQAPSGFQAGDDPNRRNGLIWSEVDFDRGCILVEPLRWNDDDCNYTFDTDMAPSRLRAEGRDGFELRLPGREPLSVPAGGSPAAKPSGDPPEGWQIIDAERLSEMTATRPGVKDMADWFNGSFPRWEVANADGVRPRQIVDDLVRVFEAAHHAAPNQVVRLLTGAGGEGKSAALLQAAASLIKGKQSWRCLWRQSSAADLPDDWAALVPRVPGQAWIVAIDDAENVGAGLPEALRKLRPRTDVHLILAAREADWALRGLHDGMWQNAADFRRMPLVGLDMEDARRIAEGWHSFGPNAMGRLQGQTPENAALALLGSARTLSANKEEGTLLGALLIVREGEELRERVGRLMIPWVKAAGIGGRSLLDIYAAIVAMHAENQLYLSRTVLSYALRCEEADLDAGPLRVLRREAMVDGGTTYVLTRHRRIAEVARDWLVENEHDIDQWYPVLARAAHSEFKNRRSHNPDINNWQWGLVRYFVDCGPSRWPLARKVAEALFHSDVSDALLLTNYAGTLRRTERPGDALVLLRRHGERFKRRRDVLYEWSVAAGSAGDHGLAAWLAARSLADDPSSPLDLQRCKISLAGLGATFREHAGRTAQKEFIKGQVACGRLGLRLTGIDAKTRGYFEDYSKAAPLSTKQPESVEEDIRIMQKSVVAAYYETDPENDRGMEDLIGEPDVYKYKMLAAALSNPHNPYSKVRH